jgi:hypothetical protein
LRGNAPRYAGEEAEMEISLSQRIKGTLSQTRKRFVALEKRAVSSVEALERRAKDSVEAIEKRAKGSVEALEKRAKSSVDEGLAPLRRSWTSLRKRFDVVSRDDFKKLGKRVDEIARRVDRITKAREQRAHAAK